MAIDVDRSVPLNLKLGRDWSYRRVTFNQSRQELRFGPFARSSTGWPITWGRLKVHMDYRALALAELAGAGRANDQPCGARKSMNSMAKSYSAAKLCARSLRQPYSSVNRTYSSPPVSRRLLLACAARRNSNQVSLSLIKGLLPRLRWARWILWKSSAAFGGKRFSVDLMDRTKTR
jgi:hypothetical protein